MNYTETKVGDVLLKSVTFKSSHIQQQESVSETHVVLTLVNRCLSFQSQLESMSMALQQFFLQNKEVVVMAKCFMSDAANQQSQLQSLFSSFGVGCISYVQQPPANGTKLAVWLQCQSLGELSRDKGVSICRHNGYTHFRSSEVCATANGSLAQTESLFEQLESRLQRYGCHVKDACVRTWFHVRDIDTWYHGVVEGRKKFFATHDLTLQTHYLASTGIGGQFADTRCLVSLDAHCIGGLSENQVNYLYACDYLNPTADYGVTFERGATVDFGDRRLVYISGTASIDNRGEILYCGEIINQCQRACTNVEALLREAQCDFTDVALTLVYLRDMADYEVVQQFFSKKLPTIPFVVVIAPVCRPGWLIEMECIALKERVDVRFPNF